MNPHHYGDKIKDAPTINHNKDHLSVLKNRVNKNTNKKMKMINKIETNNRG